MEQVGIALAPRTVDMCEAVETMFEGKLRAVFTGDPTGYHPQNRLTLYWGELEWVHLDGVIRIKANSTLVGVVIRSRDKLTSLRMNTFLHNLNLAAGRGAALPFVQVAPIGADNDLLTVWYDSKEKQILAKRGCFKGTIEEFLRSAQARYGDSSTPGGAHIFYTYQNLLPTLVAQVRSLMPGDEK